MKKFPFHQVHAKSYQLLVNFLPPEYVLFLDKKMFFKNYLILSCTIAHYIFSPSWLFHWKSFISVPKKFSLFLWLQSILTVWLYLNISTWFSSNEYVGRFFANKNNAKISSFAYSSFCICVNVSESIWGYMHLQCLLTLLNCPLWVLDQLMRLPAMYETVYFPKAWPI